MPQLDRFFATSDTPGNTAQRAAVVSESKLFARGCEKQSGALLPYVGTANAARDMDVLRAALGDAKLTYLGKSYGTYLGTWYAQLFPSHVRALVLDGAVDPGRALAGHEHRPGAGIPSRAPVLRHRLPAPVRLPVPPRRAR